MLGRVRKGASGCVRIVTNVIEHSVIIIERVAKRHAAQPTPASAVRTGLLHPGDGGGLFPENAP